MLFYVLHLVVVKQEPVSQMDIEESESQEPNYEEIQEKGPVSKIIFVQNLVRPFTLNQLKDLLKQNGNIVEEYFWIDKIKSKCFVMVSIFSLLLSLLLLALCFFLFIYFRYIPMYFDCICSAKIFWLYKPPVTKRIILVPLPFQLSQESCTCPVQF